MLSIKVLEGQRPSDALHGFMKEKQLAQVFKHPNLRRRLFHRLCSAAQDAGRTLDCSQRVPRILAAEVELTYSGVKSFLQYYFPDNSLIDPLYPDITDGCMAIPHGVEPISETDEITIARYGYDQSTVDPVTRRWLVGYGPSHSSSSTTSTPSTTSTSLNQLNQNQNHSKNNSLFESELQQEEIVGDLLPTEARTGCLSPTRRAVVFFCDRLIPTPSNCLHDLHVALLGSLMRGDGSRWIKAGPVGIDYYQMLRCPNDAPLPEVKNRMKSIGHEVGVLVQNTSKTVQYITNLTNEGLSSFNEANQSLYQAQASLKAASDMLKSANQTIQVAKHYLSSSYHSQLSFIYSMSSTETLFQSLRTRLLNICNETIMNRNCSKIEIMKPLSSFTDSDSENDNINDKKKALLLYLYNKKKMSQEEEKEKENNENEKLQKNKKDLEMSKNKKEFGMNSKVKMNLEEIRQRRNEMLNHQKSVNDKNKNLQINNIKDKDNDNLNEDEDKEDEMINEEEKLSLYINQIWEMEMSHKIEKEKERKNMEKEVIRLLAHSSSGDLMVPYTVWRVCLPQEDEEEEEEGNEIQVEVEEEGQVEVHALFNHHQDHQGNVSLSNSNYMKKYKKAIKGCELLNNNKLWICPKAAQRINSLLPRYPIEQSLKNTLSILNSWNESLKITSNLINNINSNLIPLSKELLLQIKTGKIISNVALKSSLINFKKANETSTDIEDDIEKSKHRSFAMERANFDLVLDKNREFYDKPCRPVFGACCARDQADGGMNIICG